MEEEMKLMDESGNEIEVSQEELNELLAGFSIEDFLSDLLMFDYLTKSNGHVEITSEDMKKVDEMRKTRHIEFSSEITEEGEKLVTARFVYIGEEKEDEKINDSN